MDFNGAGTVRHIDDLARFIDERTIAILPFDIVELPMPHPISCFTQQQPKF